MKTFFLAKPFITTTCFLLTLFFFTTVGHSAETTPPPLKIIDAELFLDVKCRLGEGPFWHPTENRLYWTDIDSCRIHRFDPEAVKHDVFETTRHIGCLVPTTRGSLLIAGHQGVEELFWDSGKRVFLADPESDKPDNRMNDGKCSPGGGFWFGSLNMEGKNRNGGLYVMHSDQTVRQIRDGVGCSNGLTWSLDGQTLYYIDTAEKTVVAFDYDPKTESIQNSRTVITFSGKDTDDEYTVGVPDGMTIDTAGNLWVAHWGGYCVSCWDPKTGRQLMKVNVPVSRVTSAAFGGENYDTLYITTARADMSETEGKRQPHVGSIFFVKPGAIGLPAAVFSPDF